MNIYSLHHYSWRESKLKIAITTIGREFKSNISPVFGRSPYILIVDTDNNEIRSVTDIENPARFEKGAGNLASEFLVKQGIETLISGEMGPIAFHILKNNGITVYKAASVDAEKNIKLLFKGKLKEVTSLSSGYP